MPRRLGYACLSRSIEHRSPRRTILPAHAEYVDPAEFARFLTLAPAALQFDCLLEARAKDLALFQVREALGIAA